MNKSFEPNLANTLERDTNETYLFDRYGLKLLHPGKYFESESPFVFNNVVGLADFLAPNSLVARLVTENMADDNREPEALAQISYILENNPSLLEAFPIGTIMGIENLGLTTKFATNVSTTLPLYLCVARALQDKFLSEEFTIKELKERADQMSPGNFVLYCLARGLKPKAVAPSNPIDKNYAIVNLLDETRLNGSRKYIHELYSNIYDIWNNAGMPNNYNAEVTQRIIRLISAASLEFSSEELLDTYIFYKPVLVVPSLFTIICAEGNQSHLEWGDVTKIQDTYPMWVLRSLRAYYETAVVMIDYSQDAGESPNAKPKIYTFNLSAFNQCLEHTRCPSCSKICPIKDGEQLGVIVSSNSRII